MDFKEEVSRISVYVFRHDGFYILYFSQRQQDSNPQSRFWRPMFYHWNYTSNVPLARISTSHNRPVEPISSLFEPEFPHVLAYLNGLLASTYSATKGLFVKPFLSPWLWGAMELTGVEPVSYFFQTKTFLTRVTLSGSYSFLMIRSQRRKCTL